LEDGKSDNAYSRIEGDHHQRIANGNFNANTPAFLYYYELQMKHMGRLNTFIANAHIPYVEDEAVRTKFKSILEALRIWHYFKLTSRWANVPFFLEPATIESAIQPPTPKEEILDQLFPLPRKWQIDCPLMNTLLTPICSTVILSKLWSCAMRYIMAGMSLRQS